MYTVPDWWLDCGLNSDMRGLSVLDEVDSCSGGLSDLGSPTSDTALA